MLKIERIVCPTDFSDFSLERVKQKIVCFGNLSAQDNYFRIECVNKTGLQEPSERRWRRQPGRKLEAAAR